MEVLCVHAQFCYFPVSTKKRDFGWKFGSVRFWTCDPAITVPFVGSKSALPLQTRWLSLFRSMGMNATVLQVGMEPAVNWTSMNVLYIHGSVRMVEHVWTITAHLDVSVPTTAMAHFTQVINHNYLCHQETALYALVFPNCFKKRLGVSCSVNWIYRYFAGKWFSKISS